MESDIIKTKTLSLFYNFSKHEISMLNYLSSVSREIYNHFNFCYLIYFRYKGSIFTNLNTFIVNNGKDNINSYINTIIKKYFKHYCNIKNDLHNNNKIIYEFIKNKFINDKINLDNSNFNKFRNYFIKYFEKNQKEMNIKYNSKNKQELLIAVINNILKSFYLKNFVTKNKLTNKNLFEKDSIDNNIKEYIKEKHNIKLQSDYNYVKNFAYSTYDTENKKITGDLKCNIMKKTNDAFKSYFSKKEKGLYCKRPNFLSNEEKYILPFYNSSRKEIKNEIRLTVGRYVSINYNDIIKDQNYVCLNKDEKTEYKKYIHVKHIKKYIKRPLKSKNYILDNNKYIEKDNKNILNTYYLFINKPNKLNQKNIKLKYVEIVPIYNGYKFKVNYIYQETLANNNIKIDKTNVRNYVSIDLGMKNLLTIYDPSGRQKIISGKYLLKLNHYFNNKIDFFKSKKAHRNKIYDLLIKRINKIDHYFNLLIKWITNKYSNKIIIIGYNDNWSKKKLIFFNLKLLTKKF